MSDLLATLGLIIVCTMAILREVMLSSHKGYVQNDVGWFCYKHLDIAVAGYVVLLVLITIANIAST